MPVSKYGSEGVHKPRGINGNLALSSNSGAGLNFAQDLKIYRSDWFGTTGGSPIKQTPFPAPWGKGTNSVFGSIPFYDYTVAAIAAPFADNIQISMGGTNSDITIDDGQGDYFSYVSASTGSLDTTFSNPYPTGAYVQFEIAAAPKGLTGTEECIFGARNLGAYNTYNAKSPSFKWGITGSKHYPTSKLRPFASNLPQYPAQLFSREFVVTYDSTDSGSEIRAFFYCSEAVSYAGQIGGSVNNGGWYGGWTCADGAEVVWDLDISYNKSSDFAAGEIQVSETLYIDGAAVFTFDWPEQSYDLNSWNWASRVDAYGCREDKSSSDNTDLRWGTSYPENSYSLSYSSFENPPSNVYNPLSRAAFNDVNRYRTDAASILYYSNDDAPTRIGEHVPPIDWFFSDASFHINSKDYDTWESNSPTGTVPSTWGLLQVEFSNLEYGMQSQSTNPNGRWLGQPAVASGYDFEFPAGNHAAVDIYTTADRTKRDILEFSSLKPRTSKADLRSNGKVPRGGNKSVSAEPYYEFGIESGSLPDGYYLNRGVITIDQDVQYDTAAGLTGTIQFWAKGEEDIKVVSDVYSWRTQGDLFAYWDNPIHSGTPTSEKPEIKNANIWVVGDPQMVMNANVSGGVPPYDLTTPSLDFGRSNVLQQPANLRLVYDDSDGSVTLPVAANVTNTDFVSTRGYVSLRDCEVFDSAGNEYDDWRGYRCQVMYSSGRVEWHECGAFPYASGDPCQRDRYSQPRYYTPDASYDLTFYSDRLDYFGFYAIDEPGERAIVSTGTLAVTAGAIPAGLQTGYYDFSDLYYEYNIGSTSQQLQIGAHTEAHGTTGNFTVKVTTPSGREVFSRSHSWICKTDGDYCTFDYGDFVHPNASPDANYDHVWADGYAVLDVDPASLPDRAFQAKFTLFAGTLPEGVSLQQDTGELSMDGALLGGEETGTYTIQMITSDKGIRRMTYSWKREGLPPI